MADIIINGPEGQSTINNIPAGATEATQENIASILKGIGNSAKKSEAILNLMLRGYEKVTKATKEGDKEIADLLKILEKSDKQSKKSTDNANKTIDGGIKELEKLQRRGIQELDKLNRTTTTSANDLDKILSDLNNSSDGLMSFAGGGGKLLGGFGLALDVATKVTGAFGLAVLGAAKFITSQFIDTFKFLNAGLKQGTGGIIGLTQSVDNVAISANMAGMSLDEFGEFAAQNSKILRTLGAEGFAKLYTTSLIAQGGLMDIGMTADDAVESVMTELEYRRRFGLVLTTETVNLRSSLMQSARELRVFANAVGMSEADLRAQSEVAENHIDMLQANAMMLGANSDEIINSTQTISRQLGAAGLGDLINPLFEAISKGSTGLSEEFIEIGKVAPELITMVEKEAASFAMTGQLNAELSGDIIEFMRNLSDEQMRTMFQLQAAGDGGATALNNLRKNVNRLTKEQVDALTSGELDTSRLNVLDSFNTLGFIVNQATASIGDMGKVAVLSALGFDDAASGTVDFNKGITSLSENILDMVTNVFGKNTRVYEVMESFNNYIQTMFGDITDEEEIEKALSAFKNSISKFGQNIGLELNKMITEGTLLQEIKGFFKFFFDEMILAFNQASGGVLMGEAADRINLERFRGGEISTDQFLDGVGGQSGGFLGIAGGDRSKVVDQVFRAQVLAAAEQLQISKGISDLVKNNQFAFGDDSRNTSRFMSHMEELMPGFSNLSEADQKRMFDARLQEIRTFNGEVDAYIEQMLGEINEIGMDTHSRFWNDMPKDLGKDNFKSNLNALELATDINDENIDLYLELFRRADAGALDFSTGLLSSAYQSPISGFSFRQQYDAGVARLNSPEFAGLSDTYSKKIRRGDRDFTANDDFQALLATLKQDMTDDNLFKIADGDQQRFDDALSRLRQHDLEKEDSALLRKLVELINVQRGLTNAIMTDGGTG